jgi:thioredoxin-related protein
VRVDGPYKEKLEKYFKEHPEATKELKTLSALNTLNATQENMRLYNKENNKAITKKEKDAAADHYAVRSAYIQALSGLTTFKDGTLTSTVSEYMESVTSQTPGND